MADIKDFIVAIDLGSSKVTAIAGRKQPDGAIEVLAYMQEPSHTFIRKGRISNIDKMTQCAKNIKENFEKKLNNPGFVAKAPEAVVAQQRESLAKVLAKIEMLNDSINSLG